MDVGTVSQNALLGITKGLNQASSASADQLNNEASNKDTTQALLELKQAEVQIQASAKVAQTAGDIIGSIIDIRA
jgi:flagellar hook protein FlgE